MSLAQPLSTLAPAYNNSSLPVKEVIITQEETSQIIIEQDYSPDKPKCPDECPRKPECFEECPKPECNPCTKPRDPCVKAECPKPCDPCAKPCDPYASYGWGWLGALILWFIIFTVLFWLIFYSLKPSFVLQADSNQVDTSKVLLASLISALILVIIIWLIKAAVSRRYY